MSKRSFAYSFLLMLLLDVCIFNSALAESISNSEPKGSIFYQLLLQSETGIKAGFVYILLLFLGIIILGCLALVWDIFRRQSLAQSSIIPGGLEAITVILIVSSVVILALTQTITSEGAVGVLGSIVGYVLGKQKSSQKSQDSNENSA